MSKYLVKILKTVLVFTILLMGCAQYAHQVRDAQDLFSHGARLDLAWKFNKDMPVVDDTLQESHLYYALAVGTVNEAIRDGETDLRQDSLYGTALTIKALSLWRLRDTAASQKVANEVIALAAKNSDTDKVWPRDLGICKSLPILFKIDALAEQAKKFAAEEPKKKSEKTIDNIIANAKQTKKDLDGIVNDHILQGHPLQLFLAKIRCEISIVLREAAAATAVLPCNGAQNYYKEYNDFMKHSLQHLKNVAVTHHLDDVVKAQAEKSHTYYSGILKKLP